MRLRLLSDLHLECEPWAPCGVAPDVVVLAGDIDNGIRGVDWAARHFDCPVVYVPGNHEYDFGDLLELRAQWPIDRWPPHVRVLDNRCAVIGGVRFLGTTLWTDFALDGDAERAMATAARCMTDYVRIRHAGTALTPQDTLALHRQARAWLEEALSEPFDGKTVVVSHHCPHPSCIAAKHQHSPANPGFVSDLSQLISSRDIALWCHGHTHSSLDFYAGATRIVCNPRGYPNFPLPGGMENPDFNPEWLIDV